MELSGQPMQGTCQLYLKQQDVRMASTFLYLTLPTVVGVLEILLRQDRDFLSEEALHQEGLRVYRLIESVLPALEPVRKLRRRKPKCWLAQN
jgi:hypothetical protein